jgi:hypothetical protein
VVQADCYLLVTLALARPGGVRAVVAESLAVKHQLLIVKRSQRRSPNLTAWDRMILGFCTLLVSPGRYLRSQCRSWEWSLRASQSEIFRVLVIPDQPGDAGNEDRGEEPPGNYLDPQVSAEEIAADQKRPSQEAAFA